MAFKSSTKFASNNQKTWLKLQLVKNLSGNIVIALNNSSNLIKLLFIKWSYNSILCQYFIQLYLKKLIALLNLNFPKGIKK